MARSIVGRASTKRCAVSSRPRLPGARQNRCPPSRASSSCARYRIFWSMVSRIHLRRVPSAIHSSSRSLLAEAFPRLLSKKNSGCLAEDILCNVRGELVLLGGTEATEAAPACQRVTIVELSSNQVSRTADVRHGEVQLAQNSQDVGLDEPNERDSRPPAALGVDGVHQGPARAARELMQVFQSPPPGRLAGASSGPNSSARLRSTGVPAESLRNLAIPMDSEPPDPRSDPGGRGRSAPIGRSRARTPSV